jgi:hypothetical protein
MANLLVTCHTYLVLGLETPMHQTVRISGLTVADLLVFYSSCQHFACSLLPLAFHLILKMKAVNYPEMSVTPDQTPNSTIPHRTIFLNTTI